jgi:phage/plasmid-like protein (TIGR03299 family)
MFSGRNRVPWHRLPQCVVIAGCLTKEEARTLSKLDWTVSKRDLMDTFGNRVGTKGYGIFRDDNNVCLSVTGTIYVPRQNDALFAIGDSLIAVGNARYETAGYLGKGERVWCLINLGASWNLPGTDDAWESYLLVTNGHDREHATQIKEVDTRVVCQNTLNKSLSELGLTVSIRHTAQADAQLAAATQVVETSEHTRAELHRNLETLASKGVTMDAFTTISERLFPIKYPAEATVAQKERAEKRHKEMLLEILNLYDKNDDNRIDGIRGSGYNLLNAITEYQDHFAKNRSDEARAISAIWGPGATKKEEAVQVIMEATASGPNNDAYARLVRRYSVVPEVPIAVAQTNLLDAILSQ